MPLINCSVVLSSEIRHYFDGAYHAEFPLLLSLVFLTNTLKQKARDQGYLLLGSSAATPLKEFDYHFIYLIANALAVNFTAC